MSIYGIAGVKCCHRPMQNSSKLTSHAKSLCRNLLSFNCMAACIIFQMRCEYSNGPCWRDGLALTCQMSLRFQSCKRRWRSLTALLAHSVTADTHKGALQYVSRGHLTCQHLMQLLSEAQEHASQVLPQIRACCCHLSSRYLPDRRESKASCCEVCYLAQLLFPLEQLLVQ